mmetsp:Transcript_106970/g.195083  ORF Transcript_106970/g.195083 Transcript_106970/m.195083 type:complete len:401 (+) Transcript_106970:59-1261(+)
MRLAVKLLLGFSLLVGQCQGHAEDRDLIAQTDNWLDNSMQRDPSEVNHDQFRYVMQRPTTTPPPTTVISFGTLTITTTPSPLPTTTGTLAPGEWPTGKKVAVGVIGGVGGAAAIALTGVAIHASVEQGQYSTFAPTPAPTPAPASNTIPPALLNAKAAGAPAFNPAFNPKAEATEVPTNKSAGVSSDSSSTSSGGSSGSWIFWVIFILLCCCCNCCGGAAAFFFKKQKKSRKVKKTDPVPPPVAPTAEQITDTMPLMSPVEAAGPLMDSRVKYNPVFEPAVAYTTPEPTVTYTTAAPAYSYASAAPAVYTTPAPAVYTAPATTMTMAAPVTTTYETAALPTIMEAAPVATTIAAAPVSTGFFGSMAPAKPVMPAPATAGSAYATYMSGLTPGPITTYSGG